MAILEKLIVLSQDGNAAVIFMPDDESRIHKIDGETGERIWTQTIEGTVGFGISELKINDQSDYIVSGGIGETQERWVARLNGADGSVVWSKSYNIDGDNWEFDAVRMTTIGDDGFIYGAGFVGGDEPATVFIVYAGQAMVMKIDPETGDEVWTHTNSQTEYAMAVVQDSNGDLYYGSKNYDEDLTLTKLDTEGNEAWTTSIPNTDRIIPADLDISSKDEIYFGGHAWRNGLGDPFDYSCVKLNTEAQVQWINHYANPRSYCLDYIRNELYGIKVNEDAVYMFGGTGDESGSYSETNPPFNSSDVWNGWVLITDFEGNILRSDVFCHEDVNTATEYGDIFEGGYMIFNDTDAFGDTEVGVMKVFHGNLTNANDLGMKNPCADIFPNPANEFIEIETGLSNFALEIIDSSGRAFTTRAFENTPTRIEIQNLPPGIYFLKISNEQKDRVYVKKFIKS